MCSSVSYYSGRQTVGESLHTFDKGGGWLSNLQGRPSPIKFEFRPHSKLLEWVFLNRIRVDISQDFIQGIPFFFFHIDPSDLIKKMDF